MKTIKVLVSGASGDVAQGIIKALESSSLKLEIYKTCINQTSSWLYKDDKSYIVPLSKDDKYLPTLTKIIKKHHIDVFIPAVDSEIPIIAKNKELLESETSAKVFVDEWSKIECCDDKYLTYKFLTDNNFPSPLTIVPTSIDVIDVFLSKVTFPFLSKSRRGRGSANIVEILNTDEAHVWAGREDVILQEYLDGEEYTTGIYLGDDKEVKGVCTLKRELKGGSTFIAKRIINEKLESKLEDIAKTLGIKYVNIQTRLVNNMLIPFEFNGRFSGTTGIISRIFNAPEMCIREKLLGQNLHREENNTLFQVMRYYEEIYADETQVQKLIARSMEL